MASTFVFGRRPISSRATERCCSRSPRLDPNATYATSRIPLAHDRDFGIAERTAHRRMRLAHRDPDALDDELVENAGRDGIRELFEVEQRGRFHDVPDLRVHAAIVDDVVAGTHPRGEIDLERLWVLALVR